MCMYLRVYTHGSGLRGQKKALNIPVVRVIIIFYYWFIDWLQSIFYSLPIYLLTVPHPILPPHTHLHVNVIPTLYPIWPLNSLGPPVSWGLGVSSLNEHRPGSPLLYMCWRHHISWCMLSVWWSSVWEILGVQINWDYWSSNRIALLFSFFQTP